MINCFTRRTLVSISASASAFVPRLTTMTTWLAVASLAVLVPLSAHSAPQNFKSKADRGTMDEFFQITVIRDCTNVKFPPYVTCQKQ